MIYHWKQLFKQEEISLSGDGRSGSSSMSTTEVLRHRQWSCHVERFPTLQRLREKMSDTLYRYVVDCPSFSARY
ncbi:hypothetical protein TNCV_675451 [Trichonephila clavipes]|nr:hypothetical protein TNCV_675451 [Trichonephila clavipes]